MLTDIVTDRLFFVPSQMDSKMSSDNKTLIDYLGHNKQAVDASVLYERDILAKCHPTMYFIREVNVNGSLADYKLVCNDDAIINTLFEHGVVLRYITYMHVCLAIATRFDTAVGLNHRLHYPELIDSTEYKKRISKLLNDDKL